MKRFDKINSVIWEKQTVKILYLHLQSIQEKKIKSPPSNINLKL